MGLLESRQPVRSSSVRSNSGSVGGGSNASGIWGQRYRSRFARLVLFKKIDYVQLICAVAVFFFFIFLFQIFFLPGSVTDDRNFGRIHGIFRKHDEKSAPELPFLKELDFGEDVKLEPLKILTKFRKDDKVVNDSVLSINVTRFGYRKPKLALVSIYVCVFVCAFCCLFSSPFSM